MAPSLVIGDQQAPGCVATAGDGPPHALFPLSSGTGHQIDLASGVWVLTSTGK